MSMKLSEDFTKKLGFSEEGEEIRKLERSWRSPITAEEAFEDETDDEEINRPRLRKVFVESHIPTKKVRPLFSFCGNLTLQFVSMIIVSFPDIYLVFWIERAGCDDECVILVTATESPDDMKSMAVEAILLLQEKINDDDEETVKMQLLVPSRVIGCVIGRSGSVNASIRISKGNNDDLVEVIMILTKVQIFSPSPFVSSVPEYASIDFDQRRETWESSLGMVSSDRFYGYESSFPARDRGLVSVSPYSYG
ncbi:hypothetical protein HID58_080672, partial [Brassica napus]